MSSDPENWKCSNCGELIEPQFDKCWNCGTSSSREAPTAEPTSTQGDQYAQFDEPPTPAQPDPPASRPSSSGVVRPGLPHSVLTFVLCPPVGLIAVLYSILAEFSRIHRRSELVSDYSERAQFWRFMAYAGFVILTLLWLEIEIGR